MEAFALAYLNGFSILILILVLRNYRQKLKFISREEKVFILLVCSAICILLVELVLKLLWGAGAEAIRIILYSLQTLDFMLAAAISILWLYYCIFRVNQDVFMNAFLKYLIPLPAVLFSVFMISTSHIGAVFEITSQNTYQRGPVFILGYAIPYIYIASAFILVLYKRKLLNRGEVFPYLLVPLVPAFFGLMEILFRITLSPTWAATSLVLLEIQMYVLNRKTNIDHLTGLNNRMALDTYIKRTINESRNTQKCFGLVMLDIDNFKLINDEYGHTEGDRAIKAAADILRDCFSGNHFLARYGGDEFTVVIKSCDHDLMDRYLNDLDKVRSLHNKSLNNSFEIEFSIGSHIFRKEEITDVHTMLMYVDKIMYQNKASKR